MVSVTCYPSKNSQTSGSNIAKWNNLVNVYSKSTNYAETNLIKSKNSIPNHPAEVTVTNFNCNIPEGAVVKKITVYYRHSKVKKDNNVCNISAPAISLVGVKDSSKNKTASNKKGTAPTTTAANLSVSFTSSTKLQLSRSEINSKNFGVKISYPSNTNTHEGYLRLRWVYLKIEYINSEYGVVINKFYGQYAGDPYQINVTVSNKHATSYSPTVTISIPTGLNVAEQMVGEGSIKQVDANTLSWKTRFNKNITSNMLILKFDTNVSVTGNTPFTRVIEATESLNNASARHTVTLYKKPTTSIPTSEETPANNLVGDVPELRFLDMIVGEEYYLTVHTDGISTISGDESVIGKINMPQQIWSLLSCKVSSKNNGTYTIPISTESTILSLKKKYYDNEGNCTIQIIASSATTAGPNRSTNTDGTDTYSGPFYYESIDQSKFWFVVNSIPPESSLSVPYLTILPVTGEELNRLGDLEVYTVQSFMKAITTRPYLNRWYKNFRLGVFNNAVHDNVSTSYVTNENGVEEEIVTDTTDYNSLTDEEIFSNADYWSEPVTKANEIENITVDFPYDENYPLYVLVTGEYNEGFPESSGMLFTNPCIVESEVYTSWEPTGTYPIPIRAAIGSEDSSELSLPEFEDSTPIVFSRYGFDEDYGTSDELAITGISVSGEIQSTDELVIFAKLKKPNSAEFGERSIVLSDDANSFSIGGFGDLWGFKISDMKELEHWEVEFQVKNSFGETVSNIQFNNVVVTFFVSEVDPQETIITIDGENLAWYGSFIIDANVPAGLETDTRYITVEGTDTNDSYRQNVEEKTIELDFWLDGCSLKETTKSLRLISKLLVNERDRFNRPIPKRLEISDYPDIYWEYVMEETFDNDIELTSYHVKAKLVVPAGTAFTKETMRTSTHGYIDGIARVPVVVQVSPAADTIEIVETISNQKFNMSYAGDWADKIVEIDCENHIVKLKETASDDEYIDISSGVDMNADWFSLIREFDFRGTNCFIRTVEYQERW